MLDLHNSVHVARGISPAAATTDDTAWVSEIIDVQDYNAVEFLIMTGSLADADATFTVLFEHGDESDLSDNAAVPDTLLLGTEALAGFAFGDDNEVRKIGYVGDKRYLRVTITPANNTGNAFVAGCWLLKPKHMPAANPPV